MNDEEILNALRDEIREYLLLDDDRLEGFGLIRAVLVKQLQDLNEEAKLLSV